MSVFTNDNWELDAKNGAISENGKIIVEVFGATDFNPDNSEAMLRAKVIAAAPKMYELLKNLTSTNDITTIACIKSSARMLLNRIDKKQGVENE